MNNANKILLLGAVSVLGYYTVVIGINVLLGDPADANEECNAAVEECNAIAVESTDPNTEFLIGDCNTTATYLDPNNEFFTDTTPWTSVTYSDVVVYWEGGSVTIRTGEETLRITGDTDKMDEAAKAFFEHYLKDMVDNYIKENCGNE